MGIIQTKAGLSGLDGEETIGETAIYGEKNKRNTQRIALVPRFWVRMPGEAEYSG